jgi:hypothetical protein
MASNKSTVKASADSSKAATTVTLEFAAVRSDGATKASFTLKGIRLLTIAAVVRYLSGDGAQSAIPWRFTGDVSASGISKIKGSDTLSGRATLASWCAADNTIPAAQEKAPKAPKDNSAPPVPTGANGTVI